MDLRTLQIVHTLPLWFLVVALFLPRLAIALMWLRHSLDAFHLRGLLPPLLWLIVPRVLVLYLVFIDQGISLWFLIHLAVALLVWGGSGSYHTRRRPKKIRRETAAWQE